MKILCLADQAPKLPISRILSDNPEIEMIITLGDLSYDILLDIKKTNIPKIGVYGNHCSGQYMNRLWIDNIHLENRLINWISFIWLEWCHKYKDNAKFQYSQDEVEKLIKENFPEKVDVIISHSPPYGINDNIDLAHIWFKELKNYIDIVKPKYLFHWHTYDYWTFIDKYNGTNIIYVEWHKIIDIDITL